MSYFMPPGFTVYVNGQQIAGRLPQGRRPATVEVDEYGNVAVYLKTPGRPPRIPPEIRQRIRTERAAGSKMSEIAAGLDEDGVPTPNGGPWRESTIQHVLSTRKRDRAR